MLNDIREKELLPKGPEDETLPTQIAGIDQHITFLKSQLATMTREISEQESEKTRLLARAKEVRVFEDTNYKLIDMPVYPAKHVDVDTLKRLAPEKYALIVQNLTEKAKDKLQEQMAKIQVKIAQSDVKAVISDKGLLAQIIPEPKEPVGWEVSIVKKK